MTGLHCSYIIFEEILKYPDKVHILFSNELYTLNHTSHAMRKTTFWIWENKGTDNRAAGQRLWLPYIDIIISPSTS